MSVSVNTTSGNSVSVSVNDGTTTTINSSSTSVSVTSPSSSSITVTEKGPKGDTGATGAAGAAGATGATGAAGSDGTSPNAFTTLAVSGQANVVADGVDDTLTLAAGSNVTITTNASSDTVTIASADTNTQLSTEQVQDIVGGMFTGNTETRISATYQDDDGTIDLEVDAIPVDLTSDGAGTIHANNVPTLNQSTTGNAATATALATARAINGVNFDGTAPITVTAAGSTLSDEVPVSKGGTGATSFASNAVLTGNLTQAIQAESALTYDATADTLQLTSSTGGYPRIELKSEANVTGGQRFVFIKDRGAAPADGDTLGVVRWEGEDSGQNATAYAQIFGKIAETTDGQEGGHLGLQVASHDGEMTIGLELVDGDAEDEIDVNIGSGTSSITTVAGVLKATSGISVGNHIVDDIDLAGEFVDSDSHLMTSAAINDRIAAVGGGSDGWHGSTSRIKILPRDFLADDGGRPLFVDDTNIGIEQLFLESFSSNPMYASIAIPTGFKATHVKINGSATDAVEVWEFQIDSKTGVSKGTGNVGTEIDITDVTSSTTNYLFIGIANASGNEIHGGYVTIAAV